MLQKALKAIRRFRQWRKDSSASRELRDKSAAPEMGLLPEETTSSWTLQDEESDLKQEKELNALLRDILSPSAVPSSDPIQPSPLMALPPEIRLIIYDYCLVVAGRITPYPSEADRAIQGTTPSNETSAVALLQVSRQIREEARPSLYGKNVWCLSGQSAPLLPYQLWIDNRHLFRHLFVRFDHRDVSEESRSEISAFHAHVMGRPAGYASSPVYLQRVADDHEDMFLSVCNVKLYLLNRILPFLRSVSVNFEWAVHPTTGERGPMIERIGAISSSLWTIGSGTPFTSADHDPASQKRCNDPTTAPWHGLQWIVISGVRKAEEDLLFP
ncbi:MAG: hypothetical protein LQ346_003199 [Caloplaca aetnensis]|nr:MAG: hypothetical protein LQ346_003199 [Caloplaca aetnensis]